MSSETRSIMSLLLLAVLSGSPAALFGDVFTYTDRDGESQTIEAKLVHQARQTYLVALPDGEYRMFPEAALEKRESKPGPQPLTPTETADLLEDRFGSARFFSYVEDPFVIGLVLSADLPDSSETRARNFLRRVAGFMDKVSSSFKGYLRDLRIPVQNPEYPLVVLVFESDNDFDRYMAETTQTNAVMVKNVAGFYSGMTNYLAIRISTCNTFEVPLHEAIHQQVYNRNFFQRLAPIPHWFDEGIATGFEANRGRINIGPSKISARYARQALAGGELSWDRMLTDDKVFQGNVLVGEAYGHAWSLHWLLVTKYNKGYYKYVNLLSQKKPLEQEPEGQREADIQEAFGQDLASLHEEFQLRLKQGLKQQRVKLKEESVPGQSVTHDGMGKVDLKAVKFVDRGGAIVVEGTLTNECPYRKLDFYVTVETAGGLYASWYIPDLGFRRSQKLERKKVNQIMQGGSPNPVNSYRVRIRSAPAGSQDSEKWANGDFPVPIFGAR